MTQQMVQYIKLKKYITALLKVRRKSTTTVEQVILHIHITDHIRQYTLTNELINKSVKFALLLRTMPSLQLYQEYSSVGALLHQNCNHFVDIWMLDDKFSRDGCYIPPNHCYYSELSC